MKVLEMENQQGVKRYYSGFYCTPFYLDGNIWYMLNAEFYDCLLKSSVRDVLMCESESPAVLKYCVELVKQLAEQPEADHDKCAAYLNQVS